MRARITLASLSAAVLLAVAVLVLTGAVEGQTDPPASGDWIVADTTSVSDAQVDLDGDLVVTATGRLTLENVTLTFSLASNGEHGVEVQAGGTLTVTDGDADASTTGDASRLTTDDPGLAFYFIARADSAVILENSFVERCGHTGHTGQTRMGLYFATDEGTLDGMVVNDCLQGLVMEGAHVRAFSSSFTNCTYHGVVSTDSTLLLEDCTMADNGYEGARIVRGDAFLERCAVVNNRNGVVGRSGGNLTIANSTIRGNTDGVLLQVGANIIVRGCTIRSQTQYGIHAENRGDLIVEDTVVSESTRTALFTNNQITVASSDSVYRSNVYGVRLNMDCHMTSHGDEFSSNTNSGVYLESTSTLTLVSARLISNVAGAKAEDSSTLTVWDTVVEDCSFEGYKLATGSTLDLHDGSILNCTGGGIVATASATHWFVHPGNHSRLVSSDIALGDHLYVRGDMEISASTLVFRTSASLHYGMDVTSGHQDWDNCTFRPSDGSHGMRFRVLDHATLDAWNVRVEDAGWTASSSLDEAGAVIEVPCSLHSSTFTGGIKGLSILEDATVEGCTFSSNTDGVLVEGADVRFENCTFTGNTIDLRVDGGASAALVNCSFDGSKVSIDDGASEWSAYWIVHVTVSFPSGHEAAGADVEVRDASAARVYHGVTDGSGVLAEALVLQHVTTRAGRDDRTPHNFSASFGNAMSWRSLSVDGHMTVAIELADPDLPQLQVTSHSDGDHVRDPVLVLEGTASDGGSSVLRVDARISTQPWSRATGEDSWQWTVTLPGDGTYPITVRARDFALNDAFLYLNITLDTRAPLIVLEIPPTPSNNSLVGDHTVTLKGYADRPGTQVVAANVTATMDGRNFTVDVPIEDGQNDIWIVATDLAGNVARLLWVLDGDLEAPRLSVSSPANGSAWNTTTVPLEGLTDGDARAYFRILEFSTSWSMVGVTATGKFDTELQDELVQGRNTLEVMVRDVTENEAVVTIVLFYDTMPPGLVSISPEYGSAVRQTSLNITGSFSEELSSLRADGQAAVVDGANFSVVVYLKDDDNSVSIRAVDLAGNEKFINLVYILDRQPPHIYLEGLEPSPSSGFYKPLWLNTRQLTLVGTTELGAVLQMDGWAIDVDEFGAFTLSINLEEGLNMILLYARDLAGNEFSGILEINLDTYAPMLEVSEPEDKTRTDRDFIWVRGNVTRGDKVSIGDQSMVSGNGTFEFKVSLEDPINRIVVTASDDAGNSVSIERLVFTAQPTEGVTGVDLLDSNCYSILVVIIIGIAVLGAITGVAWRGSDVYDRREKHLENVLEDDRIELDKPHLEPTTGYLKYDPSSPTGRKQEMVERDDEDFVSMSDFKRSLEEMERNGNGN